MAESVNSTIGRPRKYTKKMGNEICERLSSGESLRAICKDAHICDRGTVFRWLLSDAPMYKEFCNQYAIARKIQAECMFDDINEIADNEAATPLIIDGELVRDADGNPVMTIDMVGINHARLRIDSRKWSAARLLPKKYGEKPEPEEDDNKGQSLNINFSVNDAVGEVKVTNANA